MGVWIKNNWIRMVCFLSGLMVCLWVALKAAPFFAGGIPGFLSRSDAFTKSLANPFVIHGSEQSGRLCILVCMVYALAWLLYFSTRKNYRRGREHGSAQWTTPERLLHTYAQDRTTDKILSQGMRIGFDTYKHRRNLNTIVIGGSGAGKTRFYIKPNLLQINASYVVLDPAGELMRDTVGFLRTKGYRVQTINLYDMLRSSHYNPFVYLESESDVYTLINNLIKATTPAEAKSSDPFWDNAATALLSALVFLCWKHGAEEDKNFGTIMYLLEMADVDENNAQHKSILDSLFDDVELEYGDTLAVRQYRIFKQAAGKTAKSILITLAVRLQHFTLPEVAFLTGDDTLQLGTFGDQKTILYLITPTEDKSFNFIISMLYQQLFQQLYRRARICPGSRLPIPVQILMDEFANVSLPPDFNMILSTVRKFNISVDIVLQSLAQLKELYKDSWEAILGNCDTLLFLGGNEPSTFEYLSKLLGKETIDSNTYGQSKGTHGSTTTNYQTMGRELLTAPEIREFSNDKCILLIRGEKPLMDKKYDLLKHPHVKFTPDSHKFNPEPTKEAQASSSSTVDILGQQGFFQIIDSNEF